MTLESVDGAVRLYRENKVNFIATDGPLTVEGFRGWLRTSKAGRAFMADARAAERNPMDPAAINDGPPGWKTFLAATSPVFAPGGMKHREHWRDHDAQTQGFVLREMPRGIAP